MRLVLFCSESENCITVDMSKLLRITRFTDYNLYCSKRAMKACNWFRCSQLYTISTAIPSTVAEMNSSGLSVHAALYYYIVRLDNSCLLYTKACMLSAASVTNTNQRSDWVCYHCNPVVLVRKHHHVTSIVCSVNQILSKVCSFAVICVHTWMTSHSSIC